MTILLVVEAVIAYLVLALPVACLLGRVIRARDAQNSWASHAAAATPAASAAAGSPRRSTTTLVRPGHPAMPASSAGR